MSNATESRRWVRQKALAQFLNVTEMTVWRWQRDPSLNFPKPSIVNGLPYTDLDEVSEWMKSRVVSRAGKVA
jgi:predicted DNA-binding transcriptional regulator AlpA